MKLILVLALLSSVVLAQVPQPFDFDWSDVKDIWEHPRLQPAVQNIESRFVIHNRTMDVDRTNGQQHQRIVGGHRARVGQFPFYVLLIIDDMWLCGGSLLNANSVLTAAHCIYLANSANVYSIVDLNIGYYWTSSSTGLYVHADYDEYNIVNDIGLIKTSLPAPNNMYTAYINLPRNYAGNSFARYSSTIQGFGRYSDKVENISEYQRYVGQHIMVNERCLWQPNADQLCTATNGGRGPCNGDSGGGLFIGHRNNHNAYRVVVGIVSYGAADGCELGYPAVFTRVTSYMDWIDQHMASIDPQ